MIKQLQMGIKLLRYTHGIVANTVLGVLILLVGIIRACEKISVN